MNKEENNIEKLAENITPQWIKLWTTSPGEVTRHFFILVLELLFLNTPTMIQKNCTSHDRTKFLYIFQLMHLNRKLVRCYRAWLFRFGYTEKLKDAVWAYNGNGQISSIKGLIFCFVMYRCLKRSCKFLKVEIKILWFLRCKPFSIFL